MTHWYHIAYFASIIITVAVMGYISWYSRLHRNVTGAGIYMWVSFFVTILSVFQGISMIAPSVECALFWFNMRILCFAVIPVIWLVFVLHYTGKQGLLSKARVAFLFVIPVITQVMLWTNNMHGMWAVHDVGFRKAGPFSIPLTTERVPGPWMTVHNLYTYGMMLIGIVILFAMSARLYRQYRRQAIALSIGTLVIIIGSLFPAFNLAKGMELNPLPQSFALGSLIIAWGMYRYRFLNKSPVYNEEKRIPVMLTILFVFFTIGILFIEFFYYRNYERHFRLGVEQQLSSIAELKIEEILQWRKDRLGDANSLYKNDAFTALAQRLIYNAPDAEGASWQLKIWLGKIQSSHSYKQILLLDTRGTTRIFIKNRGYTACELVLKDLTAILSKGTISFIDFHRDSPGKPIHLSIIVPVLYSQGNAAIGAIVFIIDPNEYLYPMINRWHTPSNTAETLLVRRDGDDVLFLNELRFKKDTALNLRYPLNMERLPAAAAAIGKEGIMEGIDYRGVPVVASLGKIADSPWHMVARIDISEAYAPLRERLWIIVILTVFLFVGAGSGIWILFHRQMDRSILKQIEAADKLTESERKFRNLYNNAQVGLFETSLKDAKIIACNQRYCDMAGFHDIDSAIGMDILQLYVNPDDREEVKTIIRQQGYISNHVLHLKKYQTGAEFWVEFSARLNQSRDIIEGTIIDVTERKQVEEALRESERRFRETVINLDEGFYSVTLDGLLLEHNEAFKRILGFDETANLVGVRLPDFWQKPDERNEYLQALQAKGSISNYQINAKTITGEKITVLASAHFVKDKDNRPLRIEGVFLDITQRIRAEEEIRRLNEQLEQKVIERTASLKAANKELEAFSYSVSHDLRAPLRAIDGFSKVLLDKNFSKLDNDSQRYLNIIRDNTQNMGQLIDDLLSFSRIGKQEMRLLKIDMEKLAGEIFNRIKTEFPGRIINFRIESPPAASGDFNMIKIVLTNLLSNAVKFTGSKSEADIEFGGNKDDNENLYFIKDNGAGFDMNYVNKLFGVFQRLHSKDEYEGTGVGLALVQRIIHRHGGRVWAEGRVNEGSVFYFTLPVKGGEA